MVLVVADCDTITKCALRACNTIGKLSGLLLAIVEALWTCLGLVLACGTEVTLRAWVHV